jgi:hypothetical protein
LTQIDGVLDSPHDVDTYRIMLDGGGTFSATTEIQSDKTLDTVLYLFDSHGIGVYANDDTNSLSFQSTLPAHNPLTPTSPGIYFLTITSFNLTPVSAGGLIFPVLPFEAVSGPTGPGGGSPVTGYTGAGSTGNYSIALTGAQFAPLAPVPEPQSMALLVLGSLGIAGYRWFVSKRPA